MKELFARLKSRPMVFAEMTAASLLVSILGLASSLFVIQVLNRYVAHGVDATLTTLAIGTVIAHRAGFDPVRGAEFFARIPDPGNRFLGTHPPNSARIETVRRVARRLK